MTETYKLDTQDNTKIILTKPVDEIFTIESLKNLITTKTKYIAILQTEITTTQTSINELQAKIDNATSALNLK